MDDDIAAQLRALWPTDDASGQDDPTIPPQQLPQDGELILAADHPAHPWVTDFRNRNYSDAGKLAKIIGNGATPDDFGRFRSRVSVWLRRKGQNPWQLLWPSFPGDGFGTLLPGTDRISSYRAWTTFGDV